MPKKKYSSGAQNAYRKPGKRLAGAKSSLDKLGVAMETETIARQVGTKPGQAIEDVIQYARKKKLPGRKKK